MSEGPFRSSVADVPTSVEDPAGKFRVAPLITPKLGSPTLFLGSCWIDTGAEPVSWTADSETHEAYFLIYGSIRVTWTGDTPGAATLNPEDALFLAPDRTYTVTNIGGHTAFLVYAMTPPPPETPDSAATELAGEHGR